MKALLALLLAGGLFLLDRLTKAYFLAHPADYIGVIPKFLWLQYSLNDKMALSLPLFPLFYYTLVAGVMLVLSWKLVLAWTTQRWTMVTVIAVLLAGAISNLLDRLLFGGVVDFITLRLGSVFNVADIMIVASVIVWIIMLSYADRSKTI